MILKRLNHSILCDKAMVKRLQAHGFTVEQAKLAYHASMRVIHEALLEGFSVRLYKLGDFNFRLYRGRTFPPMPGFKYRTGPLVIPDLYRIRFTPSPLFSRQMRGIKPKYFTVPKPTNWVGQPKKKP